MSIKNRVFTSRGMLYICGTTIWSWGAYNFYAYYDSKHWPRVDGRILGIYPYFAWMGDDKERYHVDYEYEWEGKKYIGVTVETGSAWAWWMGNFMRDTMGLNETRKGRVRPGGLVKVFVNPKKPHQSGLFRTVDANRNGYISGIGASMIAMAWYLPKNHRFELVRKIEFLYRRRLINDTRKTRIIDVIFDRSESKPPLHKQPNYVPDPSIRERLGLDSDKWDNDVQQKRINRLKKEADAAGNIESSEKTTPPPPKISSA
eukprot:TRINITY_DN3134_c0_g1_i1.p1 TRINITY_DN3134_c0_g1~~TRINITY_DN3134_c0_g1_i1.p1  ORF type:complete len:273 (+),score=43.12 TRINITY_DN3134_c0_g1_i1:44-820(+)